MSNTFDTWVTIHSYIVYAYIHWRSFIHYNGIQCYQPFSISTSSFGGINGSQLAHGDRVVGSRRRRRSRYRRRGGRHRGINDVGLRVRGGQGELRSRGIACRRHVICRREGRARWSTNPGDHPLHSTPDARPATTATSSSSSSSSSASSTTASDTDNTPNHPQPRRGGPVQRVHRADRDALLWLCRRYVIVVCHWLVGQLPASSFPLSIPVLGVGTMQLRQLFFNFKQRTTDNGHTSLYLFSRLNETRDYRESLRLCITFRLNTRNFRLESITFDNTVRELQFDFRVLFVHARRSDNN